MSGAPILLQRGNYRRQFADFLDRFAAGTSHDGEWSSFVLAHYPDEFLEEMRRCTVRLGIGELPCTIESPEGKSLLRAWAVAIRSAVREDA
jgi:hypothetical protein